MSKLHLLLVLALFIVVFALPYATKDRTIHMLVYATAAIAGVIIFIMSGKQKQQ